MILCIKSFNFPPVCLTVLKIIPSQLSRENILTVLLDGKVGDEVEVIRDGPVDVRRTRGVLNKPLGDVFCQATKGERFLIIAGPKYEDNIWWWKVSNSQCGEGWIADLIDTGERFLRVVEQ